MRRAWLVVILLLPSAATAATLDATLAVLGESDFTGTGTQDWTTSGSMLDYRDGLGDGSLELTGSITWRIIEFNLTTAETPAGSAAGSHSFESAGDAYTTASGTAASAQATPVGQRHQVRLVGEATATHDASFRILPSQEVAARYLGAPDAYSTRAAAADFPAGGGRAQTASSTMECSACRVIAFDADVVVDGVLYHTGIASSTRTPDPLNQGAVTVDVYRIFEADVDAIAGLDGVGWVHYITALSGNLTGDIQLHDAAGTGTVNGTAIPAAPHLFQAIGNMTVDAAWNDQTSRWELSGDADFVAVNAATIAGSRPTSRMTEAAAVAAATGLIATLLAIFTNAGRALLTNAAALLVRVDAKSTQVGQQILKLLHDRPVASRTDMCQVLGISDFKARYYSKRLVAQNELQETVKGGEKHFMLNHSSLRFPVQYKTNDWTQGRADEALASINHPTRRMLFDALRTLGNADYQALRAHLGNKCPSAPSVSKHLKEMEKAGAIKRFMVSEGQRVRRAFFTTAMVPEELHRHQHDAR